MEGVTQGLPVTILAPGIAAEVALKGMPRAQCDALRQNVKTLFDGLAIDINMIEETGREKKLLIADMDSTMIEQECIDELARKAGIYDQICTITERAMNGELDFESALTERVYMLKGLSENIIEETYQNNITFTSGASILIQTMKKRGSFCALVSGGFTQFTTRVANDLGFDHNEANHLEISNGKITGEIGHPILGREAKAHSLMRLSAEQGISLNETIAVGDGANDLDMLGKAGIGVALHAKPAVAKAAHTKINFGDLTALLYLQGISQQDQIIS